MKKIILKAKTQNTPFIHFNAMEGIFEFMGKLVIDNDNLFFDFVMPLITYLEEYKQHTQKKSVFLFHIEYLDEKSNSFFYDIMGKIYAIKDFSELKIIWYYSDESEEELGYNFQEYFVGMPFEFINILS